MRLYENNNIKSIGGRKMSQENKTIMSITKMSYQEQNQRLRLFARMDLATKLNITEQQNPIFHKLRVKHQDKDKVILSFSAHILAIDSVLGRLDDVALNASKLNNKSIRVRSKRDKIISYWAIVKTLKLEQNMSFRQIVLYLKKYHKLDVAHSTLHNMWSEIEQLNILN